MTNDFEDFLRDTDQGDYDPSPEELEFLMQSSYDGDWQLDNNELTMGELMNQQKKRSPGATFFKKFQKPSLAPSDVVGTKFGTTNIPFLDQLQNYEMRTYNYTPGVGGQALLEHLQKQNPTLRITRSENVKDIYVYDQKGNTVPFQKFMNRFNFEFTNFDPKLVKRISRIFRPSYNYGFFQNSDINIGEFTNPRPNPQDEDYDGVGIITHKGLTKLLDRMNASDEKRKEIMHSGRFEGTLLGQQGEWKGHLVVQDYIPKELGLGDDVDIAFEKGSWKKEFKMNDPNQTFFDLRPSHFNKDLLLDPQSHTNIDSKLVDQSHFKRWMSDATQRFLGNVLTNMPQQIAKQAFSDVENEEQLQSKLKMPIFGYITGGADVNESPTMIGQLFNRYMGSLQKGSEFRMPYPGAFRLYMTNAAIKGQKWVDQNLKPGQVYFDSKAVAAYFHPDDWAEAARRHGGADQDDSMLIRVAMGNLAVMNRSPNVEGELSVMDVANPEFLDKHQIPNVPMDLAGGLQNIQKLSDKTFRMDKFPPVQRKQYSQYNDFATNLMWQAQKNVTTLGAYINVLTAYTQTFGNEPKNQIAPNEAIIDALQKDFSDVTELDKEIKALANTVYNNRVMPPSAWSRIYSRLDKDQRKGGFIPDTDNQFTQIGSWFSQHLQWFENLKTGYSNMASPVARLLNYVPQNAQGPILDPNTGKPINWKSEVSKKYQVALKQYKDLPSKERYQKADEAVFNYVSSLPNDTTRQMAMLQIVGSPWGGGYKTYGGEIKPFELNDRRAWASGKTSNVAQWTLQALRKIGFLNEPPPLDVGYKGIKKVVHPDDPSYSKTRSFAFDYNYQQYAAEGAEEELMGKQVQLLSDENGTYIEVAGKRRYVAHTTFVTKLSGTVAFMKNRENQMILGINQITEEEINAPEFEYDPTLAPGYGRAGSTMWYDPQAPRRWSPLDDLTRREADVGQMWVGDRYRGNAPSYTANAPSYTAHAWQPNPYGPNNPWHGAVQWDIGVLTPEHIRFGQIVDRDESAAVIAQTGWGKTMAIMAAVGRRPGLSIIALPSNPLGESITERIRQYVNPGSGGYRPLADTYFLRGHPGAIDQNMEEIEVEQISEESRDWTAVHREFEEALGVEWDRQGNVTGMNVGDKAVTAVMSFEKLGSLFQSNARLRKIFEYAAAEGIWHTTAIDEGHVVFDPTRELGRTMLDDVKRVNPRGTIVATTATLNKERREAFAEYAGIDPQHMIMPAYETDPSKELQIHIQKRSTFPQKIAELIQKYGGPSLTFAPSIEEGRKARAEMEALGITDLYSYHRDPERQNQLDPAEIEAIEQSLADANLPTGANVVGTPALQAGVNFRNLKTLIASARATTDAITQSIGRLRGAGTQHVIVDPKDYKNHYRQVLGSIGITQNVAQPAVELIRQGVQEGRYSKNWKKAAVQIQADVREKIYNNPNVVGNPKDYYKYYASDLISQFRESGIIHTELVEDRDPDTGVLREQYMNWRLTPEAERAQETLTQAQYKDPFRPSNRISFLEYQQRKEQTYKEYQDLGDLFEWMKDIKDPAARGRLWNQFTTEMYTASAPGHERIGFIIGKRTPFGIRKTGEVDASDITSPSSATAGPVGQWKAFREAIRTGGEVVGTTQTQPTGARNPDGSMASSGDYSLFNTIPNGIHIVRDDVGNTESHRSGFGVSGPSMTAHSPVGGGNIPGGNPNVTSLGAAANQFASNMDRFAFLDAITLATNRLNTFADSVDQNIQGYQTEADKRKRIIEILDETADYAKTPHFGATAFYTAAANQAQILGAQNPTTNYMQYGMMMAGVNYGAGAGIPPGTPGGPSVGGVQSRQPDPNDRGKPEGVSSSMWSGGLGRTLYAAYIAKRLWSWTAAPVMQEAEAYGQQFAGERFISDDYSSRGMAAGRAYQSQMYWSQGAYEQFGGIGASISDMFGGNAAASRIYAGGKVGLGITSGGIATLQAIGMMDENVLNPAVRAGTVLAGKGLMWAGLAMTAGSVGMEVYNQFWKPEGYRNYTYSQAFAETAASLNISKWNRQYEQYVGATPEYDQLYKDATKALGLGEKRQLPRAEARELLLKRYLDAGVITKSQYEETLSAYGKMSAFETQFGGMVEDISRRTGATIPETTQGLMQMRYGLGGELNPTITEAATNFAVRTNLPFTQVVSDATNYVSMLGNVPGSIGNQQGYIDFYAQQSSAQQEVLSAKAAKKATVRDSLEQYFGSPYQTKTFEEFLDRIEGGISTPGQLSKYATAYSWAQKYNIDLSARTLQGTQTTEAVRASQDYEWLGTNIDVISQAVRGYTPQQIQLQGTVREDVISRGMSSEVAMFYPSQVNNAVQWSTATNLYDTARKYTVGEIGDYRLEGYNKLSQIISPYRAQAAISLMDTLAPSWGEGRASSAAAILSLDEGITDKQAMKVAQVYAGDLRAASNLSAQGILGAGFQLYNYAQQPIYQTSGQDFWNMARANMQQGIGLGYAQRAGWVGRYNPSTTIQPGLGGLSLGVGLPSARDLNLQAWGGDEAYAQAFWQGGAEGAARLHRSNQAGFQRASAGVAMASVNLQREFYWGSGSWDNPAPGSMWALQDTQIAMQRRSTLADFAAQRQRMDMQNQYAIQQEAISGERMGASHQYQGYMMGYQRRQFGQQQAWTREDWQYQTQMRTLDTAWSLEDFEEGLRTAHGRDRRRLLRERERFLTKTNLEGEQIEKQKSRQEIVWEQEEERMKKQEEYQNKLMDLERKQFSLQKKQREEIYAFESSELERKLKEYNQMFKLEEEMRALQREHTAKQLELQATSAAIQAQAAEDTQLYNEGLSESTGFWQDIEGSLKNIIDGDSDEYFNLIKETAKATGETDVQVADRLEATFKNIATIKYYTAYKVTEVFKYLNDIDTSRMNKLIDLLKLLR